LIGGDGNDYLMGNRGRDTLSGGSGDDTYVFFQDQDNPGTRDVILDWNPGDKILLCGQASPFYRVTKIWFQAADNDLERNDVGIALSDGTFILVKNAADEFDEAEVGFEETWDLSYERHGQPQEYNGNLDNFLRGFDQDEGGRAPCYIECDFDIEVECPEPLVCPIIPSPEA
jgi:hypothetical protein